jgi:hypothetical protein
MKIEQNRENALTFVTWQVTTLIAPKNATWVMLTVQFYHSRTPEGVFKPQLNLLLNRDIQLPKRTVQQYRLTSFNLCHDKRVITFTQRREHFCVRYVRYIKINYY